MHGKLRAGCPNPYSDLEEILFIESILSFPHKIHGTAQLVSQDGHGLALAVFLFPFGDERLGALAFAQEQGRRLAERPFKTGVADIPAAIAVQLAGRFPGAFHSSDGKR